MLNLLFISNNSKVQHMKSVLQPLLKVIIDVVPDFDHGLKDVFEKRPSTVCIQDQIAGVTGESVARHIQMLLGTGAPRFILMHDGNSKVKPIKGLFEHVIELSQPDADLVNNFQDTLKALLGDQWAKIYVPPMPTAASVLSSVSVSDKSRVDADKLVDDFLLDLESTKPAFVDSSAVDFIASPDTLIEPITHASVQEVTDMLLSQASEASRDDTSAGTPAVIVAEQDAMPSPQVGKASTIAEHTVCNTPGPDEHRCQAIPIQKKQSSLLQSDVIPSTTLKIDETISKAPTKPPASESGIPPVSAIKNKPVPAPVVSAVPIVPSEFKISQGRESAEEPIPEELLLAFEKNYRSKTTYMQRSLLVLLVLIGVSATGWYFRGALKQLAMPTSLSTAKPASTVVRPIQPEKKIPQVKAANPNTTSTLPSFVPMAGHDSTYAVNNPGWERYVGENSEIRVFKAGSTIKAIQVLSTKGNPLSDSFLKSVLMELVGSADYRISSSETKSGVLVSRGKAGQNAEILVYKKKSKVRAFVISLD